MIWILCVQTPKQTAAWILLCYLTLLEFTRGNQFDPHLFPKRGPFFEGWYLRLFDFNNSDSLGFLFGHVLPKVRSSSTDPLVLSSVLYRTNCKENRCVLMSKDAKFRSNQFTVTKHGKPISEDPDDTSPSAFEWYMTSDDSSGSFICQKSSISVDIKFGNVTFRAEIGAEVPWGPHGEGPEGWIDKVPFLPLHWFVYSLRSPIIYYELNDTDNKVYKKGVQGTVHLEKNWGDSFPTAWIWSQGILAHSNISFALSGGPVDVLGLSVTAFLVGYRNPNKNISLNFRPTDSVTKATHNGCQGYVNITVRGLFHELRIVLLADMSTFSDCLLGPESTGFRKACVESYDAMAEVVVFKRELQNPRIIDKQIIPFAALEFGGTFICDQKCS